MGRDKEQPLFNKINIIGLGLMGGSIALACRNYNIAGAVSGFDVEKNTIDFALDNKIIDQEFKFVLEPDDLTIIASPLSGYQATLTKLKSKLNNSLLIDIGSLKSCVIDWAKDIFRKLQFNLDKLSNQMHVSKIGIANYDGILKY